MQILTEKFGYYLIENQNKLIVQNLKGADILAIKNQENWEINKDILFILSHCPDTISGRFYEKIKGLTREN